MASFSAEVVDIFHPLASYINLPRWLVVFSPRLVQVRLTTNTHTAIVISTQLSQAAKVPTAPPWYDVIDYYS